VYSTKIRVFSRLLRTAGMLKPDPQLLKAVEDYYMPRVYARTLDEVMKNLLPRIEHSAEVLKHTRKTLRQLPRIRAEFESGKRQLFEGPTWVNVRRPQSSYVFVHKDYLYLEFDKRGLSLSDMDDLMFSAKANLSNADRFWSKDVKAFYEAVEKENRYAVANLKAIRSLVKELRKIATKYDKTPMTYKTDFKQWPYLKQMAQRRGETVQQTLYEIDGFMPEITFDWGGSWGDGASWKYTKHILKLNPFTIGIDTFDLYSSDTNYRVDPRVVMDKLDEIRVVLRHEVIHVSQTLLGFLSETEGAGSPIRRDRNIPNKDLAEADAHGVVFNDDLPGGGKMIPHHVRDVEHYTRLSDEVNTLRRVLSQIDPEYRKRVFNVWVGLKKDPNMVRKLQALPNMRKAIPRVFLTDMRKHRPKRYKKTVSEMYTQLSDLLK